MKLQLSNFDKIIFDMDGVITSEMAYWQTAAVAVCELLLSHEHYGVCGIDKEWYRKNYIDIFNTVMCGGRTVIAVKRLGVNTNWDLLYVVFCVSKYLNPELDTIDAAHFQGVCMFIENIDAKAPEVYDLLSELAEGADPKVTKNSFSHSNSEFWNELYTTFDTWYNGSEESEGLKTNEKLLFSDDELNALLKHLTDIGIRLGIGTGRPKAEIDYPLIRHGLYDYFDKNMYATYNDVSAAEAELNPTTPLAKPDPFVFLKAVLGKNHSNTEIRDGEYSYEELSRTLIVGDAPCDLMAAQRGGFQFLAVLTGAEGETAREYFEQNGAEYILNNILEMID